MLVRVVVRVIEVGGVGRVKRRERVRRWRW